MTVAFRAVLFTTAVALTGCGGGWAWRDRSYPLPEQALAAQTRDLEREVAGVAPLLDEDRLPGAAVAFLASQKTLLALHRGADTQTALFRSGLRANDAAAGVQAAQRAGLFAGGVATTVVDHPESRLVPAEARWTLLYLPRAQDGTLQWWLVGIEEARAIEVPEVPAAGEDRFDRFVDGLQAAARALRSGQGFAWPGWTTVTRGPAVADLPGRIDGPSSSFAGIEYDLFSDSGTEADAQRQIAAGIEVLTRLGGRPGPRVDLPPAAPATARCRVLFTFPDRVLVAELQAAPGRVGIAYAQGPVQGLRIRRGSDRDLADEDLAPPVRRVLSSLRLR
ncbi:MAG: hypothetical protein RLZZ127_467 [Planctomycetota bacterium]|jgi:hypothetical protein